MALHSPLKKSQKKITPADLLSIEEYAKKRSEFRKEILEIKRYRRLEVGPFATFYFECYATMLQQIQEMLYIEKGGAAQIEDELAAYNPLIPQGSELVATLMFEIEDPIRRARMLAELGLVERTIFLQIGDIKIAGKPEEDQMRTNESGKTSSVHFVRFSFSPEAKDLFCKGKDPIIIGFTHPHYAHMAAMPENVRKELAKDFD